MRSRSSSIYRLVHKDYNEKLDEYLPQRADFYDLVTVSLPAGHAIVRNGIWYHCCSANSTMPQQGWKIHVSATPANAREILGSVIDVLFKHGDTDFKFALDMSILFLLNSKNWSRGGSGKFVTIYPKDNSNFLELIENLHVATRGMSGPYILSDYRYKESGVVFYRYGGMRLHDVLNIKGERTPMLIRPDGTAIPDERLAYPITPAWADNIIPVEEDPACQEGDATLGSGRYLVEKVLDFSNAGGVYLAVDQQTNNRVVIKEARPFINDASDGHDAVSMLQKEFQILTELKDTPIAPGPIEIFQEWEHWFLVEEYIEGSQLSAHTAESILLRTRVDEKTCAGWYQNFCRLAVNLAKAIEILHSRNIVFADLSTNNIMLTEGKTELKLIDFEGAYRVGIDQPSRLYTPGFASQDRLDQSVPAFEDDYYSIGAVLLSCLLPINGLGHLKPEAKSEMLTLVEKEGLLPPAVAQAILNLLRNETGLRPRPAELVQIVDLSQPPRLKGSVDCRETDYQAVVGAIISHIESAATYNRRDRLFPADSKVFTTNPLSVAHGAAGVAYAMMKIKAEFPERVVNWMLGQKITRESYAPGLYLGVSGIAWVLQEIGLERQAQKLFDLATDHPLLHDSPDLFYGTAGWGMTNLRFFLQGGDELYLDEAIDAGRHLLRASCMPGFKYSWEQQIEGRLGLAHGGSGIALFLLYLYLTTNDERYLGAARDALERDLAFGVETKDKGTSWGSSISFPSPIYPYWRYGSAGIGMAALRFAKFLGDDRYNSVLQNIFVDTDRKYAVLPGRFIGLAGLGDFMLDMHDATSEPRYLDSAFKIAEGIMFFRVNRSGITFPGETLSRLSCDYGAGSAGISLFLNRLSGRQGNDFMLDSFFGWGLPTSGEKIKIAPARMSGSMAKLQS